MSRKRLGISLALGALIATVVMVTPASAVTAGTWTQYPNGATQYQAEIQQPINSANTSNWSAKSKGGIPIMYKLSSGTGPAVFESIWSDNASEPDTGSPCAGGRANDCAFVTFTPSTSLLFKDITDLSTDYTFTLGDCHGGSLRWSVRVSPTQSVFIYYGAEPNTVDCNTPDATSGIDSNQSGENMIGKTDLRYDTSQVGGTFYDSYADALDLVGNMPILRASLVLDGGWGGDQRATISNTTVNGNVYQWNAGATGAFASTCDLPNAFIDISRIDPTPSGDINETTVYPQSSTDAGNQFRVVDCKYQYVLSIPSLPGKGTYDVEIEIPDGNPLPTVPNPEVRFDLK